MRRSNARKGEGCADSSQIGALRCIVQGDQVANAAALSACAVLYIKEDVPAIDYRDNALGIHAQAKNWRLRYIARRLRQLLTGI
eukprot:IDg8709t1